MGDRRWETVDRDGRQETVDRDRRQLTDTGAGDGRREARDGRDERWERREMVDER